MRRFNSIEMPSGLTSHVKQDGLSGDVSELRDSLGALPEAVVCPAFVVVSGLPGTSKSFFCRKLAEKMPSCILESDALRKVLFPSPDYDAAEKTRLFSTCHSLIEQLLEEGTPVIFDAANLSEHHREHMYHIGDKKKAKLVLVRVEALTDVVYSCLQVRSQSAERGDQSDADWSIYKRMKPAVDIIQRNHFVVNTSHDIDLVICKVIGAAKH